MSLTEKQVPYTGPYGLVASGLKSKGPTAEALKRGLSRLGYLPWREFDQQYNAALEAALDKFDPGGKNGYGDGRWKKIRAAVVPPSQPHAGEPALDFTARTLIQDEAGVTSTSSAEATVQTYIAEWWTIAAANQELWSYDDTFRPVPMDLASVQPKPAHVRKSDCSSTVIIARRYAMLKSGLQVADPAKQNWSGYGNTDWYEDDWPVVGAPYRIGDLGHFFSPHHVIECIKSGDQKTALWGSNGRMAGPEIFTLATYSRFPSEFRFVVRPDLIP